MTARSTSRPLISIVLPVYNEAAILGQNLDLIVEHMKGLEERYRWELILVDDGSNDGTAQLADTIASAHAEVRVDHHPMNLDLGEALRTGFRASRGNYVVTLDADLTYSLDHVELMLRKLEASHAHVILASPYMKGGKTTGVPGTRLLLSKWANRFLALTARGLSRGHDLSTFTGMVRAYDGPWIRSLVLKSTGMEINSEIIYKTFLLRGRIEEVPAHLDWSGQQQGPGARRSHMSTRRNILFSLLSGFLFRPFMFFIVPSLLLFLVSLYVLVWICINTARLYVPAPDGAYFDDAFSAAIGAAFQQSPHAFFVGGIALILAVQFLSLGLVSLQSKRYFEELFFISTSSHRYTQELAEKIAQEKQRG